MWAAIFTIFDIKLYLNEIYLDQNARKLYKPPSKNALVVYLSLSRAFTQNDASCYQFLYFAIGISSSSHPPSPKKIDFLHLILKSLSFDRYLRKIRKKVLKFSECWIITKITIGYEEIKIEIALLYEKKILLM